MNDLSVEKYLERIGIEKVENPSLAFLAELQIAHLYSIPFEDLDIPDRARIILDIERIYNKLIYARRGGFCYELNGLFHWLLTQLSFKVDLLSARVYNHQKQELGPEFDHMTLLVHLDKDYLVDVGFGDSFRSPIEMPRGECEDVSGHYKVSNIDSNNFEILRFENSEWKLQYSFTTNPRNLSDFKEMCDFHQDNPFSHFRSRMKCTIATTDGRITLSDGSLTITENDNKKRIEIKDPDQFFFLLFKYFGIKM
ncbi:MAG: arylamine N-acetyltransferase [Melioribacteraceae bacterium]|nr:arylamine N-acetyltransferase [Melioribacteraceae bacterium]